MKVILAVSIFFLSMTEPVKTPADRGLYVGLDDSFCTATSGRLIASSNSNKNDDGDNGNQEKNQNQNGKKDLELLIIPVPNDWSPSENYSSIIPLNSHYAGGYFATAVFAIEKDGDIADAEGLFRFTWSNHNYVDPSHPKGEKKPVNTHWDYEVHDGKAVIRDLSYSECGVIKLTGMIQVRLKHGNKKYVVHGESGNIDFHPHHYELSIDQQPANQGMEASYTYSGQPFASEATITAFNGKNPAEITENYEGTLAEGGNHALQISIQQPNSPSMTVSYQLSPILFSEGIAHCSANPMILTFPEPLNPQTITFQYRFSDANNRTAIQNAPAMEFRYGRFRIHDRLAIAGSLLRIFIDIQEYRNDRWQLNAQEESLSASPADLSIQAVVGGETPAIAGGSMQCFGGKIRGGENPLSIQSGGFQNDSRFEIHLAESSPLHFLESTPGRWILYQPLSPQNHLGYLTNNRVFYEKDVE